MSDQTGRTLGNYRAETLLGSGGMGQVFRGVHIHLNRPVAIKILHEQFASDPTFQARFLQEAKAAAALDHPNIVEIVDFGQHEGRYYLVMELISDGSVRALLQQQASGTEPLPLALGVELVRQAAEGLAYAHSQGMVHRDIKPDNLLTQRSGQNFVVKITDFGLARLAEGGVATAHGMTMGTPAYMSPEQCQAIELDGRSDIYSLGVVLYEVCTGYLPFETKSLSDAVYKHVYTEPPSPKQTKPDLPDVLDDIILRCLRKAPAERYANAGELASALAQVLTTLQPSTPPAARPMATQIGQAEGVRLLLDRDQLLLTPGQPVVARATLANLGQESQTVELSVEGVPREWLQLPPGPVQVAAGAQQAVPITVNVPRAAASRAQEFAVTIRATSRANPAQPASAQARWTVAPFADSSLQVVPAVASGRSGADFKLTIANNGNAPAEYAFAARDDASALQYAFEPAALTIEPGATGSSTLRASAPRRWTGKPVSRSFHVDATSGGGPPLSGGGQFTHMAMFPGWFPIVALVALLALGGGGAAYAFMGGDDDNNGGEATATIAVVATATNGTGGTPTQTATATSTATATEEAPATETVAAVTETVPVVVTETPTAIPTPAQRIVFHSNRGQAPFTLEIMVMNADGTGQQQLTNDAIDDGNPAWSPDGTKIAYTVNQFDANGNDIAVMNADGSGIQILTSSPGNDEGPMWSPDSSKILFTSQRDGNNEIYIMNADGSGQTNLTNTDSAEFTQAWSPDGTRIAFASNRDGAESDLYVMNADGSDVQRLTTEPGHDVEPDWSPNGEFIAFVAIRGDARRLDLITVADGSIRTLVPTVASEPHHDWRFDSLAVAYIAPSNGGTDLFMTTIDGADLRRLTDDASPESEPDWSPDGTQIVFTKNQRQANDENDEIFVIDVNTRQGFNLSNAPFRDWKPSWSPPPPP